MSSSPITALSALCVLALTSGVCSLALGQHEEVLVAGYNSNAVHRYSATDGAFLGTLDVPTPLGIAYGPDGNLYVAAESVNKVLRFDALTRQYLDDFVADDPATPDDETGGLTQPAGVAFGPDHQLYVTSFDGDSVLRYDGSTGAFIDLFVASGSGGLNGPDAGTTFGPDGNLYVPSYWNHRVLRFDGATGTFIDVFVTVGLGGLNHPRAVVFRSDGLVYVSSEGSGEILRYDQSGSFVDSFFKFEAVTGFGLSAFDGNVYATSVTRDSVRRFDGTTGNRIDTLVPSGSGGLSGAVFFAFLPAPDVQVGRVQPGVAGQINQVEIANATPGSLLFLFLGSQPGSIALPKCPHRFLGISDFVLFAASADAAGELLLQGMIDPALTGARILMQSFDPATCRISNLVDQTIH